MAIRSPLAFSFSSSVLRECAHRPVGFAYPVGHPKHLSFAQGKVCCLDRIRSRYKNLTRCASKADHKPEFSDTEEEEETKKGDFKAKGKNSKDEDDPLLMTKEERWEFRKKIREMIAKTPDVEEEQDPEERKKKMQKLLTDYPLVVEEEDPEWPEDADGRGFNLDQFFDKITIKNVKKEENNEGYDSEKEIVWQDDNYIRPIKDITSKEWEDTVFTDFNPLVILVHNRYKRPHDNEKARIELDRAVQVFWETGLPSPRCVAVDAVVEQDLVAALKVSTFPEIIFTKAGNILHRDKVVRTADEWSKMMAFFYYKAVRPPCLDKTAGQTQEKIPSLSLTATNGYIPFSSSSVW